jgi:hypothetical protein
MVLQPSAQIFSTFDRLLLLKDGVMAYFGNFGQDASTLITYFEQRGARRCLVGETSAKWLLDVTQYSARESEEDFWDTEWISSQERPAVMDQPT